MGLHGKAVPHAEACWEKDFVLPCFVDMLFILSLKPELPAKNSNRGEKRSHDTATTSEPPAAPVLGAPRVSAPLTLTVPEQLPLHS